jgi:G3E family GTPase
MNSGNATEQPTAAKHRLPVILVTGFLGSGKTTLLLRWLRESPATGLRMGVVMNEFGAESVDSQILDRPGLPVAQVSGGCVCCAPENELDRAVTQLAK